MKKCRLTKEQIAYAVRLAESGTPVTDVCRQIGISEATFYAWKRKYADLGVSELHKLLAAQT
jgi:putative transposase